MLRHTTIMLALTIAALAAGIYMVPGSREEWTMLVRDERNAEALDLLEQRYQTGERDPEALLQLYKLLMSFAQFERASRVIQEFVAQRPDDVFALTLLAKHYRDTQDTHGETSTLERVFAVRPSPATAQRLLVLYRLWGHPTEEKHLLAKMFANDMITANDAERLGFILAAEGNFQTAREALLAFDAMAPPESWTGRHALFDVLLRLGEPRVAMAMAEHWLSQWHSSRVSQSRAGREFSLGRLIQMMADVDLAQTRRIICNLLPERTPFDTDAFASQPLTCTLPEQAGSSVAIDGEHIDEPRIIVTTKGSEGDRTTR
jgi:tetratricopeptide (TPR) repeat protein